MHLVEDRRTIAARGFTVLPATLAEDESRRLWSKQPGCDEPVRLDNVGVGELLPIGFAVLLNQGSPLTRTSSGTT